MIRLEMKSYIMILTEKQQKTQHYHQVKLIDINILQVKKHCFLIKDKQQNQLSVHILLQKTFLMKYKQKNRLALIRSNKKDQLKQIEGIFLKNLMNDLICHKLKEIVNLQNVIKTDKLHYKSKRRKFIVLMNIVCLLFFQEIYMEGIYF